MRGPRQALAAIAGLLTVGAADVGADPWTHTVCVHTSSASKDGRDFGPFPSLEGARYSLPGFADCGGWEVESGAACVGGGDGWSSTMAGIEPNADGTGCELVIERHRSVIKEIDLGTDPRVIRGSR